MIYGSIQEDITIINIYVLNIGTQYMRQLLTAIKGEIDSNTIIVGDFDTPLTAMDKIIQTEDQQGLKRCIKPDGLNRYV